MTAINSQSLSDLAESETLCSRTGRAQQLLPLNHMAAGREGKASGRNPCMHAAEQSDIGVLPKKEPNKMVCSHAIAEVMEGRLMTKGKF